MNERAAEPDDGKRFSRALPARARGREQKKIFLAVEKRTS